MNKPAIHCHMAGLLSAVTMVLGTNVAYGQSYPSKSIRIVTIEAGGGNDLLARLTAQGIAAPLGQAVVVENRGGAGGAIAAENVAKAAPDGYTLLVYTGGMWILPLLQTASYDPVKDFSPVSLLARSPNVVVVHSSLPVKSIRELIALAKARPGQLNYASAGIGGSTHLAAELFNSLAGVNIVRVSYKGTAPAQNDLIGGQVQLMFSTAASVAPHIKSGRLRPLAVTSAVPSPLIPNLPTVAASGLPGYESDVVYGVWAPARTPASVVSRLNQEIAGLLHKPETKERLAGVSLEAAPSTPEEFGAMIKADMTRMSKVIKDTGIRGD
jgi:tripartite-type tricarboxylate transporter receptor subunit TctC